MACSALFVLDLKGRVLLSRDYRGDVSPKQAERFITKLNELEESGKVTPVILDEGVSYIYVQYSNLYLLAVAKNNINAGAILLFLHKLKEIFMHYFQELEEESLRDNFVIAYELLDEVCHTSAYLRHASCIHQRCPMLCHISICLPLQLHLLIIQFSPKTRHHKPQHQCKTGCV